MARYHGMAVRLWADRCKACGSARDENGSAGLAAPAPLDPEPPGPPPAPLAPGRGSLVQGQWAYPAPTGVPPTRRLPATG